MSKEYKIKIKKDIKVNIKPIEVEKITLKIKGKTNRGEIFNAKIAIKLYNKSGKIYVKRVNISDLEIESRSCRDDCSSYFKCRNYYNICYSSSSSSSCSSSCQNNNIDEIYEQLTIFAKNIKLLAEDNKVNCIYFFLKNTKIKKIKMICKFN
jgi:hypothetical protein